MPSGRSKYEGFNFSLSKLLDIKESTNDKASLPLIFKHFCIFNIFDIFKLYSATQDLEEQTIPEKMMLTHTFCLKK